MPKRVPNKKYTPEFKKHVVETMLNEGLNYRETERRFELPVKRAAAWECIYLEEGPEGFEIERRGRSKAGETKKFPKAVEEDLLAEVQRLRAENEYLKNCKPWFWKTSDASTENAGSSRTEATTRSETSPFNRSATACNLLLSPEANEWMR